MIHFETDKPPLDSDSPTPWGRRVRKPCRAAAGGGSWDGGTLQGDEARCHLGPGSGLCSPAGPHSGTGSPGGSPLSRGVAVEGGRWVGGRSLAEVACWGAGGRWGPGVPGGREGAAWADDQSHPDL